MSTQWISEVPDMTAGAGLNIRMTIDSARNVHVAYVVNNQLNYRIGSPGQVIVVLGGGGSLVGIQTYQWVRHDNVLPSSAWSVPTPQFDLAVDSKGRAHLCFQGIEMQDHMMLGDVQHAVWNGSAFVSEDVLPASAASTLLSGLAMTIASDDSVHIAFSDNHLGLQYATRVHDADPFQLAVVDNRASNFSNLSIAVGSGGKTGISYIFDPGSNAQLIYAEKMPAGWLLDTAVPGPITFGTSAWAAALSLPLVGTNSLVIDPNGIPHIAFFNGGPGGPGIRHVTWTTAGRGFWAFAGFGELVDQSGLASPAKMLLDKNNVLHIAYQASAGPAGTTSQLRFATRTVSGWATGTVDPSMNSGWSIAAAMDPSGEPHIAYGFEFSGVGAFLLKHTWALDLIRIPFPHKKQPINIVRRPG
jgi:hypothetical protein